MTHLDLPLVVLAERPADRADLRLARSLDGVGRWASVVAAAAESCLLLDEDAVIAALSPAAAMVMGGAVEDLVGRPLLSCGIRFVDFTVDAGRLVGEDLQRIPPLLAARTSSMARGLVRWHPLGDGGSPRTVDLVSSPLAGAEGEFGGSISFLSRV